MYSEFRVSVGVILAFIALVTPRLAWSDEDCVNCSSALSGMESVRQVTDFITENCDRVVDIRNLCGIMNQTQHFDDFQQFFQNCGDNYLNTLHNTLKNLECGRNSIRGDENYRSHVRMMPLIAYHVSFNARFMSKIGKTYMEAGRMDEFREVLNMKDQHGRTFLDFLEYLKTEPDNVPDSDVRKLNLEQSRSYACSIGAVYALRDQPDNCEAMERFR